MYWLPGKISLKRAQLRFSRFQITFPAYIRESKGVQTTLKKIIRPGNLQETLEKSWNLVIMKKWEHCILGVLRLFLEYDIVLKYAIPPKQLIDVFII